MLFMIQLFNMMTKQEIKLFVDLFDDLSFEIEEMGYKGVEDDLISDMLMNHLGYELEDQWQLEQLTEYILKKQGKLKEAARGICLYIGKEVA